MFPEFLFSSYKQYKRDSTAIAEWLAENAAKCGWMASKSVTSGDATIDAKATRLKGRARKLARDAAAAEAKAQASKGKNAVEPPKHIIKINDFVPMAACIARNSSSIKVTSGFLNLIKRCIMARSSTTDWYASKANADDLEAKSSNEKHSHFTAILEEVFRTLMNRFSTTNAGDEASKSRGQSAAQQPAPDMKTAPLANLFQLLAVEDTGVDDDTGDSSSGIPPETKKSAESSSEPLKPRYEIKHDDADVEEEWFFALQLLFNDLQYLKAVLDELWERYRDGEIDLTVPAVATNTAFDLVRRAEADFSREMPTPKKYALWSDGADLCYLSYIEFYVNHGFDPSDTMGPERAFDYRRWDDIEHCLLVPYLCLRQFNSAVKERNGKIPMMSVEQERRLVTGPRSELTPQEQRDEDTVILMSSVSVIASFVYVSNAPSEDEFCAGIRELVKKQEFPLWLVFAAQIYLDVHHILRTSIGRGLRDLQVAGNAAKATLEEHFRFMKANPCEFRDRNDDSECRQMVRSIDEWGCNTHESKDLNKYSTRRSGVRWEENCIVRKHPLLAGLLKFSIHLMMQYEGILLVNDITTVLSIAHLYNAVQLEGYLPKTKPWKDLDFVLTTHSSQDIFVGDRPTNPEDYAKRLSLSQGVSAETFAKNRRNMGPKFSKKGHRELNPVCPVAGAFRDRYCSGGSVDLSIHIAEDLIHKLAFKEQGAENGLSKIYLKHWKNLHLRLTLEDFVSYLADALQLEAPQYQFDYFALHRRTWKMLNEIKEKLRPIMVETFNETIIKRYDSSSGAVMLPSIVIAMACDITKSPNLFHIKRSFQVDTEPLKIAAATMEKLIDEVGDVEIKRLLTVCPGVPELEQTRKDCGGEKKQTSSEQVLASEQVGRIMDNDTDSQNNDEVVSTFERRGDDSNSDLD